MMAIVCGVLISTAFTLLNQASSVLIREGVSSWLSIIIVLAVFLIMTALNKKYKVNNIKLLIAGGFGTLLAMGIWDFIQNGGNL
jgi:archaellin